MAEMQALRKIPMTMEDWEKRLSGFMQLWEREILQDTGRVTAELAKNHAESEFEKYRIIQDRLYVSDFDKQILALENNVMPRSGQPTDNPKLTVQKQAKKESRKKEGKHE